VSVANIRGSASVF